MVRALTTLVGLAGAAAILYFVTDLGFGGGSYWAFALLWAAAGLAVGVLYQGGGRRAPGLRMNLWLLVLAWAPWTLLTAAVIANRAGKPTWIANWARDVVPHAWLDRWTISVPAFGFGAGLLLAFALLEPRIGLRPPDPEPIVARNPYAPDTPWTPPDERPFETAEMPEVHPPPRTAGTVTEIQPPRRVQAQRQTQAGTQTEIQPPREAETEVQPAPALPGPEEPVRELEPPRREPPP